MTACIVGWGHSRFGRLDSEDLESLIIGVSQQAMADAVQLCGEAGEMQIADAKLAGVCNMGGSAVANYVSILEAAR